MEFITNEKKILEDLATFHSDELVQALKGKISKVGERLFSHLANDAFENLADDYWEYIIPAATDVWYDEGYDEVEVNQLSLALPEEEIVNAIWGQFLRQCSEIYEQHYKTEGKRLIFHGDYEWAGLELDGKPLGYVDYSQLIPGHENIPVVVRVYSDMLEKGDSLYCTYVNKDDREMSDFLLNKQDEVLPLLLELCGVKEDEVSYQ